EKQDVVVGPPALGTPKARATMPTKLALDDVLRVNHLQAEATHNSYHLAPDPYVVPEWDYSMPTLTEQLRLGVRQLELDVHLEGGELRVYHAIGLDDGTTCATLAACLDEVAAWSGRYPAHLPLYVQIEIKDDVGGDPFVDPPALDDVILAHGPAPVTPAEVRGAHATLAEAMAAEGWPTLGETRGRAIYGLDDAGDHRDAYRARGEGVLFVNAAPTDPDAALAIVNDPASPDLPAVLAAGLLVRLFADTAEDDAATSQADRDRALRAGGHWLSTDRPDDTDTIEGFAIPGGTPARCNPVTAPPECTSSAVEDPAFFLY
ncbi:MAG: Ca2+-dependent phosphoinositide-specific phospholipase C, partial [Myxococcota bacterium]